MPEKGTDRKEAVLWCLVESCSVVDEGESRARAGIDAGAALDALVSLLGVEPGMAVLDLKEGVGAGVDAGAASNAIASDFGIARHV